VKPRASRVVARIDVRVAERGPAEPIERAAGKRDVRSDLHDLDPPPVPPPDCVEDHRARTRVRDELVEPREREVRGVSLTEVSIEPLLISCAR
jgi:hypothetical protein